MREAQRQESVAAESWPLMPLHAGDGDSDRGFVWTQADSSPSYRQG